MDDLIVLRHGQFGSDPGFTVSSTLENYFGENIKSNEAVFSVPGRDVEGTIGGSPGINGGGAAMGRGQFLTGAPGAEGEGITIKYGETTDDVIYEIFNRSENKVAGLFRRENNNETLVGDDEDGFVHVSQNSLVFHVGPNVEQSTSFSLRSVTSKKLGNGITNDSGYRSLNDIDFI